MKLKYKLDDRPGLGALLLYGLQWWVVTLPCVIIMGLIVARLHYADTALQIFYIQRLFALMGVVTVVQVLWGHRLPLVVGPATILLVGLVSTISAGIDAIYTAILVGGLVLAIVAFSGLLAKIRFLFTPRIVAVILVLIAFTMSPTILNLIFSGKGQHAAHLAFALFFVLGLILCNTLLPGVWKSLTVVFGMSLGSFAYLFIFGFDGLAAPAPLKEFSFFINELQFEPGVVLSFLICFLALLINELGSIESVGHMLGADKMDGRVRRGAGIAGLSNMAAGGLGVLGSVDFSLSAGVISATGCASRYTLIPAGIGLVACAFIPGAVGLLAAIPSPVMGALLLYLMATQLSSGLSLLVAEKGIQDFNGGLIVALPLMIALVISFTPPGTFDELGPISRPIIGNGFVMGTITVMLLEHLIFKKRK